MREGRLAVAVPMSIYGEAEPGGESLAATLSEGSAKKGGGSLLGGFASWEAFKWKHKAGGRKITKENYK